MCVGVVLYRAGAASTTPYELHRPAPPPPTPQLYQEAVHLCQHIPQGQRRTHWCGQLAYAPGFDQAPTIAQAAQQGMTEFADPSNGVHANLNAPTLPWQWIYASGLWGGHSISHWWQSGLDLQTLVWYAEVTNDTSPGIQMILLRTYQRESGNTQGQVPFAIANNDFTDSFMDDTAWWGLAWLEASRYELLYRHDTVDASSFLWLAEHDAEYVAKHGKACGGIEWEIGTPPDTITSAEFASLSAKLAHYLDAQGPFHNPGRAAFWLAQATSTMAWLQKVRLINIRTGRVRDRLNAACNQLIDGPLTYTQGEVADAFVQLGTATHDSAYYAKAAPFLRYVLSGKSGMVSHGVLEEPCERDRDGCTGSNRFLDLLVYKGILMQAFSDYTTATGSGEFIRFIQRQAWAVVHNAIRQPNGQPGNCDTAADCQFVFYWGWPLSPVRSELVNQGTQMSALDALIAELALPPARRQVY